VPLNTAEDLLNDPVFRDRGFWVEVEHAVMGKVTMPGRPFIMSETPWELRRPAPLLGEHTEEVLREAGFEEARIASLVAAARPKAEVAG
jgi:crotonobetainyl-CoA:carnitine CoA-transferase CaiB-like acyl-CoA transferase